jgi:mRNA interferase RelE/StbE
MAYKVTIRKSALKSLEKISSPYYEAIKKAILELAENPRPHGYKKLKGREGLRIRVADYRIIYDVLDNELIVDVIALGHRKEIYE